MRPVRSENAITVAARFLAASFAPGETIAILIRHQAPNQTLQRIAPLERVLQPRYLGWLAHQNADGANIHVSANPLWPHSRKRTKDSIARVRHLYLDLDHEGEARLAFLQVCDRVPTLNAIVSTSAGKYQVLWRVEGFTREQQEAALKSLARAFGGDPACTDCNRVLRLPGFLNWKYSPAFPVQVEYLSKATWNPHNFRLDVSICEAKPGAHPTVAQSHKGTNSEHDWAWVLAELAYGADADELTRTLASRRSDKRNPLYYAQRTVDIASAQLWLNGGIQIEDVITMIERRRCSELSPALGRARAREIAHTAERLVARSKARNMKAAVRSA
jgi:RepB DNA-primase from phage plasmid